MKRLITITLLLALLLPAAAMADTYISGHYALVINAHDLRVGKDASPFDFDSMTIDLYLVGEGDTGYMNSTRCISGIFLDDGMVPVRIVDINGEKHIVSGSGSNVIIKEDEDTDDLWIQYRNSFFRMHRVDLFNVYSDWK